MLSSHSNATHGIMHVHVYTILKALSNVHTHASAGIRVHPLEEMLVRQCTTIYILIKQHYTDTHKYTITSSRTYLVYSSVHVGATARFGLLLFLLTVLFARIERRTIHGIQRYVKDILTRRCTDNKRKRFAQL